MLSKLKSIPGWLKQNPLGVVVIAVVSVVFLGGTILRFYNQLRAKVPQLPAAKV